MSTDETGLRTVIRYWFDGGMRYERPDGSHVFHVGTSVYRADFDVYRGTFLGFELLDLPADHAESPLRLHEPPAGLPMHLSICLHTENGTFKTGYLMSDQTQPYVMDNGPLVHQTKIGRLAFAGSQEEQPEGLQAYYEVLFWEDCIYVIAHLDVPADMPVRAASLDFRLPLHGEWNAEPGEWAYISATPDRHLGVMPCGTGEAARLSTDGKEISFACPWDDSGAAPVYRSLAVKLFVIRGEAARQGKRSVEEERLRAAGDLHFEVDTIAGVEACYAGYDPMRGYDRFVMANNHIAFQFRTFPDELERYSYRLIGGDASLSAARRMLWQRHGDPGTEQFEVKNADIWRPWGSQAIHRDAFGMPTGHPLQISKNFHDFDEFRMPYSHCWLHIYLEQRLDELSERNEIAIAYGDFYNKLPVQIVQLSLMGWDDNPKFKGGKKAILGQLWHQGIYGPSEVFCLSPESIHTDNLYTDWRPIRTGKKGERWAANFGGGDIMRYVTAGFGKGRKGLFVAPRVEYVAYGPLLAHLRYRMVSEDGRIQACVEHHLTAGDDMARVFIRASFKWLDQTTFEDFTLFSLGAERYNPAIMDKLTAGHDQDVLSRERFALGLYDENSDAVLQDAVKRPVQAGDWIVQQGIQAVPLDPKLINEAARGLIIRRIAAKLQLHPDLSFAAVPVKQSVSFAKEPKETIRIEIKPEIPGDGDRYTFKAGDEMEWCGEIVVYCTDSEHYDGNNKYFGAMLDRASATDSGYLPALFEAVHGEVGLTASQGSVATDEMLPVIVVDSGGTAEVTLSGGFGFYPLRIRCRVYSGNLQISEKIDDAWIPRVTRLPSGGVYQADYRADLGCFELVYNVESCPEDMNKLRRTFRIQV